MENAKSINGITEVKVNGSEKTADRGAAGTKRASGGNYKGSNGSNDGSHGRVLELEAELSKTRSEKTELQELDNGSGKNDAPLPYQNASSEWSDTSFLSAYLRKYPALHKSVKFMYDGEYHISYALQLISWLMVE